MLEEEEVGDRGAAKVQDPEQRREAWESFPPGTHTTKQQEETGMRNRTGCVERASQHRNLLQFTQGVTGRVIITTNAS